MLEAITLAAFGQRRKMLRQSLKSLPLPIDPISILQDASIEPTRRAEEVDVEGFCALARAYAFRTGEKNR
jgi:16S rRNA (adenine1518-N6/adenine1519-N6)-dimethyltransferase